MGFYPPATLVRDAQRHGVEVLPIDVNLSDARCAVESSDSSRTEPVRRSDRPGLHLVHRGRRGGGARRRAGGARAFRDIADARAQGAALAGRPRGARQGRRLRRLRAAAPRPALAARARLPPQSVPGSGGELKQLTLDSSRRRRRRSSATSRAGSACSPTTANGLSVGDAPARAPAPAPAPRARSRAGAARSAHGGRSPLRG